MSVFKKSDIEILNEKVIQLEASIVSKDNKIKELETKTVNRKVNQFLQSIGADPFVLNDLPIASLNEKDIYRKFCEMPNGADKQAFLQKHEAILRKGAGISSSP